MDKKPLIGVSICAVVLLVLGSLSNVVKSENVQSCDCDDPPCWPELKGTMGDNNWYISGVSVRFDGSASSVAFRIDGGSWLTYTAEFSINTDGIHLFEWACDFNMSNIGSVEIKIDRTKPLVAMNLTFEGDRWRGYDYIYQAYAIDKMSGMNRTEFYINDELYETIIGPGPNYESIYPMYYEGTYNVRGFILNPEITDEYVKFYSMLVTISVMEKYLPHLVVKAYVYDNAGNWDFVTIVEPCLPASIVPGIFLFQNVILPNNYSGFVGRFLIKATFYNR